MTNWMRGGGSSLLVQLGMVEAYWEECIHMMMTKAGSRMVGGQRWEAREAEGELPL